MNKSDFESCNLNDQAGTKATWNMVLDPTLWLVLVVNGSFWLNVRRLFLFARYRRYARLWNSIPRDYRYDFYYQNDNYRYLTGRLGELAHEIDSMTSELQQRMEA